MFDLAIPDILPYLLAILGLLLVWEVHNIQTRAGRIKAVDIFNRSGIRLFIHVTPNDSFACTVCQHVHGTAFLPSLVAARKFRASPTPCSNPAGCRCQLVGLFGGWPEALRLQRELSQDGGRLKLSPDELEKLLAGAKSRPSGNAVDQVSLAMLHAMHREGIQPDVAIDRYREVIQHAKSPRDLPLVVPAYLRLTELLERSGRKADALKAVDEFLKRYEDPRTPHAPTEAQRSVMSLRKTRLMTAPPAAAAGA